MKDILGFEGLYAITRDGKVWGHKRAIWRKLIPGTSGYLYVLMKKKSKNYPLRVHRAVATAFIPNPNGFKSVNHKNGIKTDNRVQNLEWCTMTENYKHAVRTGLYPRGEKHPTTSIPTKLVAEVRRLVKSGVQQKEISKRLKISRAQVNRIVHGKSRQYD